MDPQSLGPRGLIFSDLDGTLLDHESYDFSPAVPAVEAGKAAGAVIILCSSKTRAELLAWQRRLGLAGPFISENGGGVFLTGDGALEPHFPARIGNQPAMVLGTPYPVLRQAVEELREEQRLALRGFGDMEAGEVAMHTGLSRGEAALAKERDFDEPFLWLTEPTDEELEKVRAWLSRRRLQMLRGGRLWHLVGGSDKGRAVRWVRETYEAAYGRALPCLGLGDSENDLPMLLSVDRGILVERPGGGHLAPVPSEVQGVTGIGPVGWANAVFEWIEEIISAEDRHG
jgi:mannosyl-3-phosphoglycerate phosphatase